MPLNAIAARVHPRRRGARAGGSRRGRCDRRPRGLGERHLRALSRAALLARWAGCGAVRRAQHAQAIVEQFDVRGGGLDAPARSLSGGNIQKLILGRALVTEPGVIIANQPTWGLDVGAVSYIHSQLLAARARGAAIVLISEDLDELFAIADRIAVMFHGVLSEARRDWTVSADRARDGGQPEKPVRCLAVAALRANARPRAVERSRVAAPIAAVAFTLLACAGLVVWAGAPVGRAYLLLFDGAFGSRFAITETLTRATPLMLTGLAAAVAFRAHFYNIGAEGQLYLGALAAVAVGGGAIAAPPVVLFPLMIVAGMAAGAAPAGRARAGQDPAGRGRGRDHAAAELRRAAVRLDDAGRADEGSHWRWAGRNRSRSLPSSSSASCSSARACTPGLIFARGAGAGALGGQHAHDLRLRDARGRRQRAGRALRRDLGQRRHAQDRAAVGGAGGAGGSGRSGGPRRLSDARTCRPATATPAS